MEWLNNLLPYLILAIQALALLIVGWVVARILRSGTLKGLGKISAFKNQEEFLKSTSNLVYYFILLITVVAVLEVLGLKYVTEPFLDLLNKVAAYMPNIVGAIVILVIGFLFAKIAREFISSLLETIKIKSLAEKYGFKNIATVVGNIVYGLIVIFVIIAALNTLQIEAITKPAVGMLTTIFEAIPKVIAAILILGIAFYVGRILADILARVVRNLNLEDAIRKTGIFGEGVNFSEIVRYLVVTFAVLLGLSQAFNYLEATALYQLTYSFILIAFKLVVAFLILFAGIFLGSTFSQKIANKSLAKTIQVAFIVAAVFIALPFVGLSPDIVKIVVFSLCIGAGLAFALAFGLGGKSVAEELLRKLLNK
ncbi:Conserved TM helix repeat-containing protein [Thermodesulfatator indicus DSM 15286]|uniref:Conserved TM helix repeat-containing protein n=1 Tax=Thermodesulfatator indicus (strain DSM 15286 / JCM 11887 / CIR29812) TaxID=667014 RepID=F8ACG4_THEID|nr:mechanosensitive ion channel [Thermodesulfatator indicus]AEH44665.1 Conserved TM helix repeat-containing protein [Thermodesulfatator indicus DSM 15286]